MEMTLLARNVTIAKLILRSLISLFFVLGLSKPVAVQVDQDTQLESLEASSPSSDEYWKYYLDCDRWGVVLATPAQFETIVESTPDRFGANAVVQNDTEQNLIIDTPPAAQIAVQDELQKPAEERQSVIEFFMSLDAPLLDDLDLLMLAAEVELDTSEQSDAVAVSPFRTASHSRIVYPAEEMNQPESVAAELAELELEIGAPVFPGVLELPIAAEQDHLWDNLWDEIFEFGEESSEWFTSEGCPAEAEGTYESAVISESSIDQTAGPLPTIALAMNKAVLKSPFWMSPSSSLDEMTAVLHFRFGQTLLYRMGQDVLFNARSEFELANQTPAVAQPVMTDAEAIEYSRQFAGNLSWLSLQLHKAAISVSRSADSRAAKIDRNLK